MKAPIPSNADRSARLVKATLDRTADVSLDTGVAETIHLATTSDEAMYLGLARNAVTGSALDGHGQAYVRRVQDEPHRSPLSAASSQRRFSHEGCHRMPLPRSRASTGHPRQDRFHGCGLSCRSTEQARCGISRAQSRSSCTSTPQRAANYVFDVRIVFDSFEDRARTDQRYVDDGTTGLPRMI